MTAPGRRASGSGTAAAWTTAALAAATFAFAFAVAELTGVRALGGAVLLLGGAWCFARLRGEAGPGRATAVLAFAVVVFVFSHVLGDAIGAWPAVAVSALVVAVAVRASSA